VVLHKQGLQVKKVKKSKGSMRECVQDSFLEMGFKGGLADETSFIDERTFNGFRNGSIGRKVVSL
jgi:hypothetical protein